MRCLVTGTAGFIGSHLSERLIKEGHDVIGVDSFIDYYPRRLKEENLKIVLTSRNFRFIEKNILDLDLNSILNDIDYIFHQAAQAGVRASWGRDFKIYSDNNVLVTQVLLEGSKEKGIKRFIYASSSSVYGDTKDIPMREESFPLPVSPYGVTKLAGEELCYLYWKNFGLPVISLRYFTVYGPRQRPDMAFNRFITAILNDKEIHLYGDGEQTRDFTYISDIIEANILAMERGREGGVYNIGGGSRISINGVLGILKNIGKKEPEVRYMDVQKGDMRHTYADIKKAQDELGFSPYVRLEDGLKEEFNWLLHIPPYLKNR
ncbi:MAG: NAD-dependent epimerase/dehydratase family protein [Nitrospinae bacterium]|nr:NAD-dependent epimerase/dehydratase family protein [Nitrospinota bacterium]